MHGLNPQKPSTYNRKQVISVGGDSDNPMTVDHLYHPKRPMIEPCTHALMPDNGRDARPGVCRTACRNELAAGDTTKLGHRDFTQPAVCGVVATGLVPDHVNRHRR
jgi:hypothetical protein